MRTITLPLIVPTARFAINQKMRKESEIFSELADVCTSPGYVHAIAYFCFRDNTIKYAADSITPDDVLQQFSMDRLVRTEISTLIGLACKKEINTVLPPPDVMQSYIDKTDAFLKEIHESMLPSMADIFHPDKLGDENFNPFKNGSILRESIFYGGEAAYHFQYRDLSKIKYKKDNDWFEKNKGYSIQQVFDVVSAIQLVQVDKINQVLQGFLKRNPNDWSILPAFKFTADEVSNKSSIEIDIVRRIIESFVSSIHMTDFKSLDDFNPINAYPIIRLANAEYLLFQNYSLVEALYETPFFWFNKDSKYKEIASKHRGEFAEEFSAERLQLVFGKKRVFLNVDIYDSKRNRVGEIDVLVVFANRAIILQAKSKKLTIAARKGNDNSLQEDFKKAVQEAYDQAFSCATFLTDKAYKLTDQSGNHLDINRKYKEIYPFCVVSDHYPALSFQARQFLNFKETEIIKPPFVMDVFLLDVITEMLRSPLYFMSYVNRRTYYGDKILCTHELTILSYHLKQNLWVDEKYESMLLEDDVCADLDLAMLTRRDGVPGIETPPGILTKYKNTFFEQIIKDIEHQENHATIDLGFMLLTLGGDSVQMINDGISQLINLGKKDYKNHDLTLGFNDERTGLTIHCNDDNVSVAAPRLENHCELRKYAEKANSWFGICIGQTTSRLRFGVNKQHNWEQSDEMDELVKDMPKPQNLKGKKKINFNIVTRKSKKIGRNDKCPCGSGKKYKQCCLNTAL